MPLEMADAAGVAKELHALLRETLPRICSPVHLGPPSPPPALSDRARAQLGTLGIRLGDRVVIAGQKVGPAVWTELMVCCLVSVSLSPGLFCFK